MEIVKNPLFWAAVAVLIVIVVQISKRPSLPNDPNHFSVNDIGYGFMVKLVEKESGKFLIEYIPNLQVGAAYARTKSWWYKTEGIPEEVLVPGTMFLPLKDRNGLKFQKVVVASSFMNDFGGIEKTYNYLDEYYPLSEEYLQENASYVYGSFDWTVANF